MLKFQQKREGAANHTHEFTPLALVRLAESVHASKFCTALYSGYAIYQVEDREKRFIVNTMKKECGCGFWELVGVPCRHAVSALQKAGELPENYISRYYSLELYRKTYEGIVYPLPSSDQWEKTGLPPLHPPIVKPKTGQPAIKRRRSRHEDIEKPRTWMKSQRCSNCKELGYNYTHYPKPLQDGLKIRKRPSRAKSNKKQPSASATKNVDEANIPEVDMEHQGEAVNVSANVGNQNATDSGVEKRQKYIKRAKMTAYRAKRRKVYSSQGGESSQGGIDNEGQLCPKYVETSKGMGIVYEKLGSQKGEGQGKTRGKPRKDKHLEGIEPPAPINNLQLLAPTTKPREEDESSIHAQEIGDSHLNVSNANVSTLRENTRGRGRGLLARGKGWRGSCRARADRSLGQSRLALSQPTTSAFNTIFVPPRVILSQENRAAYEASVQGIATWPTDEVLKEVESKFKQHWIETLVGLRKSRR